MATEYPKVEDMIDAALQRQEESERDPHPCFECDHAWSAEEAESSDTFDAEDYDFIGWCEQHCRFITSEDSDLSERCDDFKERS